MQPKPIRTQSGFHADPLSKRIAEAWLRAMSATSHYGTSVGLQTEGVTCIRCHKPLNRWDEQCEYALTTEAMLAEDVLYLIDVLAARELGAEAVDRHGEALRRLADA